MVSPMSNSLDSIFAALGDPTRRAVLAALAEGSRPVQALAEPHDMALPSFLRHIEVLEAAGLVATQKQGRQRMVALKPSALGVIGGWLEDQAAGWDGHLARLEAEARRFELAGRADKRSQTADQ
jgi:DNA-binding transcriptional ArsR family regulator